MAELEIKKKTVKVPYKEPGSDILLQPSRVTEGEAIEDSQSQQTIGKLYRH